MHGVLLRLSSKLYERLSLQELQLLYSVHHFQARYNTQTFNRKSTPAAALLTPQHWNILGRR